jgi:hypothetical protein
MGLPPVVVEISASDASNDLRDRLVDACTRAVQDGKCVQGSSSDGMEAGSAAAVAIVSWQPDGTVRIEVGLRPREAWHTRILRFDPEEEPSEVFTAVGFAIGALVGRLQEAEERPIFEPTPEPVAAEPEPPPTAPAPAPSPSPSSTVPSQPELGSWTGSVAGLVGTGRSWSSWQVGGTGAISWVHPLGALVGANASYAVSPRPEGEPQVSWAGVGVGPGYEFPLDGRFALVVGADVGLEYHRAEVTLPDSRLHGEASRVVGVGRVGVDLVGPTRSPVGGVLGVRLAAPFGATRIKVAGVPQDEPAPVRLMAVLGVRYDARPRW